MSVLRGGERREKETAALFLLSTGGKVHGKSQSFCFVGKEARGRKGRGRRDVFNVIMCCFQKVL